MMKATKPAARNLVILLIMGACVVLALIAWVLVTVPNRAEKAFGPPSQALTYFQRYTYSLRLTFKQEMLFTSTGDGNEEQRFEIQSGESIRSITNRLFQEGLIPDSDLFADYLIYSGLDTQIQAGKHTLNNSMNSLEIAHEILDATPEDVTFGLLAGWRAEEVAAIIPSSGLAFTSEQLMDALLQPPESLDLSFWGEPESLEGLLAPGEFVFQRAVTLEDFLFTLIQTRQAQFTDEDVVKLADLGLNPYQAIVLASIVEREAVVDEEKPAIASVFYNRLQIGMRLESDPTVQYAVGYNTEQKTWWTNPLNASQLQIDSPYNTYVYQDLPPTPICMPSLLAIRAVISPKITPYYFFRASCDGSGRHLFAETYEQHLNNACQ